MTVHWLFFAIVPFLEALRIYFLASDMYKLALRKGEPPWHWVLATVALWVLVEGGIFAAWWWFLGTAWLLAGVFVAILTARVLFQFLKQNLAARPDVSLEDKIEQIGSHGETSSES